MSSRRSGCRPKQIRDSILRRPFRSGRDRASLIRALGFECLEGRLLLAADFGDAPAPYPTLLAENGARHEELGPTLGALRDTEADGTHSANATADGADDDGVTFGTIRVGQLGAMATVNVQNAPAGAKLDAWIDFDGDGNWGGPHEQIADAASVVEGDNIIEFNVPSGVADGTTFARFRLSSAGNLAVSGAAADGEVEDYAVSLLQPATSSRVFSGPLEISNYYGGVLQLFDFDRDGDLDMLTATASDFYSGTYWHENLGGHVFATQVINESSASFLFPADVDGDADVDIFASVGNVFRWYENDGTQAFTARTIISASVQGFYPSDVDSDGDLDVLATSSTGIAWYENDGTPAVGTWTAHSATATATIDVRAADLDSDGDIDILSSTGSVISWHENDGMQNFTARTITTGQSSAGSVRAADIDGDGDLDVLYAAFGNDRVTWCENDGTPAVGSWVSRNIATGLDGVGSVETADLDGDGDLDILSSATNDGELTWHENDGTPKVGSWPAHLLFATANEMGNVRAGDLDGDGAIDVAATYKPDPGGYGGTSIRYLSWFTNIRYTVSIAGPSIIASEEAAQDLVYSFNRTGVVGESWTLNFAVSATADYNVDYSVSGAASFNATSGSVFFPAGVSQVQITITPIDDPDAEPEESVVLSLSTDPGKLLIPGESVAAGFIINAESTRDFGDAPAPYPTLANQNPARHTATGPTLGNLRDVEPNGVHSSAADADGVDDDGVEIGILRAGQLGATATVTVLNAPGGAKLDAWIDFDGDGNWGGANEQIASSLAMVNGANLIVFDIPSNSRNGATYARFRLSTSGNLGFEGEAANGEVEDYAVMIVPPASASGDLIAQPDIVENGPRSVVTADLDADGDMDFLAAVFGSIVWFQNDGAEAFSVHTISVVNKPRSVFAADIDGDGDLDALSAAENTDSITWYENDGTPAIGNWVPRVITDSADGAFSVYAADMDGDGDQDVLAASTADDTIAWYENGGSPTLGDWTEHILNTTADGATAVRAADLDGDGDMDVLSASQNDDRIAWYENVDNQHFAIHTITTAADRAYSLFTADVDGDGDFDVLSTSRGDDEVAWYENDGTPTDEWTGHIISTSGDGPTSIFAADVDGDGDLDVVSASYSDDEVTWHENEGAGLFSPHPISATANGARAVFAADVDRDGDLDVLSASYLNDRIVWYENENIAFPIGDYDHDTFVTEADYDFWRAHYGDTSVLGLQADGNGDGAVDAADYTVWRNNFVSPPPPGGGGIALASVETPAVGATRAVEAAPQAANESLSFELSSVRKRSPVSTTRSNPRAIIDPIFLNWNSQPTLNIDARVAKRLRAPVREAELFEFISLEAADESTVDSVFENFGFLAGPASNVRIRTLR